MQLNLSDVWGGLGDFAVWLDRPSTADGPDSRLMFFWGGEGWIGVGESALAVSFPEIIY